MNAMGFFVALVRALGAFQAGVGVHGLFPAGSALAVAALAVAAVAAVAVFVAGSRLRRLPSAREVLAVGYVLPVAVPAALHVVLAAPADWAAAGGLLRRFVAGVYSSTPAAVYLACVAYACFAAPGRGGFYR